jgi:spermidine synthase
VSRRRAILGIFVLSGAAGLIYEVVWARQLVLVFGNTTQAVSAILTGFFGGMAIGAWFGGRVADRVRSPLRLYGVLELALVVVVLLTPVTFGLIHEVYRGAFGTLENSPQLLALVRFVLSLAALGPATILMGATLPTLTRHLGHGDDSLSEAFGGLYAANTLGAVVGTLIAGLVLIELLGLSGTLAVGAGCSAIAGLLALGLSAAAGKASATGHTSDASRSETVAAVDSLGAPAVPRVGLAATVAFVSGLTSLGYQVLWTRLLASGTGNSTYVFTMILATFLFGITLGAIIFATVGRRVREPVALLAGTQVMVAAIAVVGLLVFIDHPPIYNPGQALATLGALQAMVFPVVLPATIVMGIAFPASSALLGGRDRVGARAGTLIAANTLGAIVGTFVIPFFLIPVIGSPAAVVLLAAANVATGIALALFAVRHRLARFATAAAGTAVAVIVAATLVVPGLAVDPSTARIKERNGIVFASAEDEIASVQAGTLGTSRQLWVTGTAMTLLTVDARLMPILPLVARPNATRALTVAFGMGSAFRSAVIAGLRTDAVELVPSVPDMFGYFFADAAAIKANPLGRIYVADGRNFLELTDQRYDIIVTDPPPPIESSGASIISSHEYYLAGRSRLTPNGIMMQWVPYGQSNPEFRAHLRTFRDVFPNVVVARGPGSFGVYMFGSEAPITFDPANMRTILSRPGVLDDISGAYDSPTKTIDGWLSRIPALVGVQGDAVAPYAGPGPLITDDRPAAEYFLLRRLFGPPWP